MTLQNNQRRVTCLYGAYVRQARSWRQWRGWELVGDFGNVNEEYRAGRRGVGITDWGFKRHFRMEGEGSEDFLQWRLSCNVRDIRTGNWRWGLILNDSGGVLDECMVGRLSDGEWRLVCSGTENEPWWEEQRDDRVAIFRKASCIEMQMGTLLVCGPRIYEWFSRVVGEVMFKRFDWRRVNWDGGSIELWRGNFMGGESCLICGDDWVIRKLWDTGGEVCMQMGGKMCGWDAYDIWRQEAGVPHCGVDLLPERTVFEVGLDAWVSMNKGNFVGRDCLVAEQVSGARYRWVALKLIDRGDSSGGAMASSIGRSLKKSGVVVGNITSQCVSPILGGWLGLGYVKTLFSNVGEVLDWDVRGRLMSVQVVRRPVFRGDLFV